MSIHEALDFDREKVSIITPCFNAQKYISLTYNSLKNQSFQNWEWIVYDDESTDDSVAILEEIAATDIRVKVFKNTVNSGAAVTRNNCLEAANGKYLAFLDVDDLWHEDKLQQQVQFMQEEKINFSYHPYHLIGPEGETIKPIKVPSIVSANDLLKHNPFATSSVMIKSAAVSKTKIRFKEHLRRRQDYLFWFEVIDQSGSAVALQKDLSAYRVFGSDSLSGNKKKMALIQWKLYREEFRLGFLKSVYYFIHYAFHGVKKYIL